MPCAQGTDGKVKAIPEEEDFARPRCAGDDGDLALAIRLQEEEILNDHDRNAASLAERCTSHINPL